MPCEWPERVRHVIRPVTGLAATPSPDDIRTAIASSAQESNKRENGWADARRGALTAWQADRIDRALGHNETSGSNEAVEWRSDVDTTN
jgi:hypothetical protein